MDKDFSLEKHILTRSYASDEKICELLQTRYYTADLTALPYLVLEGNSGPEKKPSEKSEDEFLVNLLNRPTSQRKSSARQDLRRYIKETLARQKRASDSLRRIEHPLEKTITRILQKHRVPIFKEYIGLNNLWKQYMKDLLLTDSKNPNLNMILPKLSTADYNGCMITVLEARDRNLIGKKGIVLFDSQHHFVVVVPQLLQCDRTISPAEYVGGLRLLAKRGSIFGFDLELNENESVGFSILGSRFELRAVDRTAKKFKSHSVEDIY